MFNAGNSIHMLPIHATAKGKPDKQGLSGSDDSFE
jgi:hypothetical protein